MKKQTRETPQHGTGEQGTGGREQGIGIREQARSTVPYSLSPVPSSPSSLFPLPSATKGDSNPAKPPAITLPDPARSIAEQDPAVLLAMCLFGEARGESDVARQAVAQVILNRAKNPRSVFGSRKGAEFAENLRCVILQPWQFSSLNPDDPNYVDLLHPLDHEQPQVWEHCLRCAAKAIEDKDRNDTLTANSDHYFDDSIQPPTWADPTKQTVKVGRLNFYRLYLPPPKGGEAGPPSEDSAQQGSPETMASDLSSGSRLRAKVSAARQDAGATRQVDPTADGRDTLARGPHSPRHNRSLHPPKFPSAHNSGPGPYPRYDWRGRLSILTLLGLTLLLAACSDFERTAYQVLAVTQAQYETTQDKVAEAAVHGLITEEQWNRFQVEGHRFIAAHNAAVDAFRLWSQTKSKNDTARVQAMLQILPQLIQEINSLVGSFQAAENPKSQTLNPKQIPNPKSEHDSAAELGFGASGLELAPRGLSWR